MTGQGLLREVRAGVFTLVCLSLSVALHSWAAGTLPAPTAVFAGAGLVLLVAVVLAGRERRFPLIAAVLLGAQAGLHYLFEAVPHGDPHMVMGGASMAPGPSATAMVLAHVGAGVCAAAWLRGGEAAGWRLCQWLAYSVLPLHALWTLVRLLVVVPARSGLSWAAERPFAVPAPVWLHSVVRRGPPAHALTLA
jgi:hypothetical protein